MNTDVHVALSSPMPDTDTTAHVGAIVNLFELSTDLLATAGPDGRFSEVSPAWGATLGWTKAELITKPFVEFIHPDDRERTAQISSNIGVPGYEVADFENRFLHRDGSWRAGCSGARAPTAAPGTPSQRT